MKLRGARIVKDDGNGLTVTGPTSISLEMRRLGAKMTPSGWHVPAANADRVRTALASSQAITFRAPSPPVFEQERLPETSEMREWFARLRVPEGLTLSQPDSYTVGFRLKRHTPEAVEAIKALPARRWNPNRGQWEVPVRRAAAREALQGGLHDIAVAIAAGPARDDSLVRVIYPLEHAPELEKPVSCGDMMVRFVKNGSLFRLNEGHSRQYPSLAPYERGLALVFYGRPEDATAGFAGKLLAYDPGFS